MFQIIFSFLMVPYETFVSSFECIFHFLLFPPVSDYLEFIVLSG